MIYLWFGDNDFQKKQQLERLSHQLDDTPEKYDGEEMTTGDLRNLLQGQTLFSTSRLIVIFNLSQSPAWSDLPDIAGAIDDTLVLVESTVDKRTKTYKWLVKQANCQELVNFKDQEWPRAVDWSVAWAKEKYGLKLDKQLAKMLVERLGVDQLRLDGFISQLSAADKVDPTLIDAIVPLPKSESVFELFEATLSGEKLRIHDIMAYLESNSGPEGAYMTLGLIVSQLTILNALVLGGSSAEIVKEIGARPFVVSKLATHARSITKTDLRKLNNSLIQADHRMKTTNVSPWLLLEIALIGWRETGSGSID